LKRAAAPTAGTVIALIMILDYKSGPATTGRRISVHTPPPAAAPATAPGSSPAPGSTAVPTTAPATATRQITGSVINTNYGPVQVRITLSGSRLVDITALQLPSDRSRSIAISQYAAPILRQEVLAAQGAQIDAVSGASYTSQGYADSLQSALDQARK
jgi:uncharacterized protein with FMN-binding domain